MRSFFMVVIAFVCIFPAVGQTKHPFTFEDMMKLKRVGAPQLSPDGNWVLFSVVDVSLEANTKTSHVWAVPTRGGPEKEIISDQDADDPHWAPDGKRFLFVSAKDKGSQVWIADFNGTSGSVTGTYKLTSIATEVDGPRWSPDGKNVLFASNVYPECDGPPAEEEGCNAKKVDEAAKSKVKAQIFTRLLYRHWNAYKEGKRSHIFVAPLDTCVGTAAPGCAAGAARDLTPGDYDAPVFSLGGQDNYGFSPDGQEICYTSNHDPVEAISTNNDLFTVPVNVGADASPARILAQTKNITADNKASDSTPLYSPDGRYIAYRAQHRAGYESDTLRLMLYDRKTGEKKNLTENLDRWVGTFAWAPDSRRIYFAAEAEGKSPMHWAGVDGKGDLLFSGDYADDPAVTPDGKWMVFTRMSLQEASGIWSTLIAPGNDCQAAHPPDSSRPPSGRSSNKLLCLMNPLTHLNQSVLSQVAMSPLEPFWFPGANGDQVEGFLVKPPNFDPGKKYPVKFLVHGGPQGAWGDEWSYRWNPELFAADGYVVIMVNFHGSTGYGQKFVDAINGDWGGAPFEDLMQGLDYAEKTYPFVDKDRECALGASYGGYMANWILGHTDRFKCIVSHDGMFNTESAWGTTEELWFNEWEFRGTPYTNREMYRHWSPHLAAANFKTPTLVIHGQNDYRLDVSEGFQLFTTLQRRGVPSKMLYFPDEGHWVLKPQNSQLWYKTVNDWVDQWTRK
jgi:dipeptidyl aminopeptidase/acylaminoacyl peptidase